MKRQRGGFDEARGGIYLVDESELAIEFVEGDK